MKTKFYRKDECSMFCGGSFHTLSIIHTNLLKLCAILVLFFVNFIKNLFKNLFNNNVIDHFRKILNNRQRQTTLDRFLKKESQDSSSAKRKNTRKRENTTRDVT